MDCGDNNIAKLSSEYGIYIISNTIRDIFNKTIDQLLDSCRLVIRDGVPGLHETPSFFYSTHSKMAVNVCKDSLVDWKNVGKCIVFSAFFNNMKCIPDTMWTCVSTGDDMYPLLIDIKTLLLFREKKCYPIMVSKCPNYKAIIYSDKELLPEYDDAVQTGINEQLLLQFSPREYKMQAEEMWDTLTTMLHKYETGKLRRLPPRRQRRQNKKAARQNKKESKCEYFAEKETIDAFIKKLDEDLLLSEETQ